MSDSEDEVHYDNTHRAFLQVFMSRAVLTFEDAQPILAAIQTAQESNRSQRTTLPADITEPDFRNYISTLNTQLGRFDYEIRSTLSQSDRTRLYALVNTSSDLATQLATAHTPDEIAYAKRLLDAMFDTYNTERREIMAVNDMQAVQLAKAPNSQRQSTGGNASTQNAMTQGSTGGSLSLKDAERMLKALVDEGWLSRSRRGFYTLSPRGLMELREWLQETYNDNEPTVEGEVVWQRIKLCKACMEIVTMGQRCQRQECQCRLHSHCTQSLLRGQQARRCPVCGEEWTGEDLVGEKAVRGGDKGRRTTGGPSGARRSGADEFYGVGGGEDED